jgi:hypothetical protein
MVVVAQPATAMASNMTACDLWIVNIAGEA